MGWDKSALLTNSLKWAYLGITMYQISPGRNWANLALEWADLGFTMFQISPVRDWADLALEWADLGFTMFQISPLQHFVSLFSKAKIRQGWYLNQ